MPVAPAPIMPMFKRSAIRCYSLFVKEGSKDCEPPRTLRYTENFIKEILLMMPFSLIHIFSSVFSAPSVVKFFLGCIFIESEPMRVLMFSKAIVVGIYQRKLEEIARRGVELLALAPPSWRDERGETPLERVY